MPRPHCFWRAAREMRSPAVWTVHRTVNSVLNKRIASQTVKLTMFDTLNDLFASSKRMWTRIQSCKLQTNKPGIASELFANFIADAMLFLFANSSKNLFANWAYVYMCIKGCRLQTNKFKIAREQFCPARQSTSTHPQQRIVVRH